MWTASMSGAHVSLLFKNGAFLWFLQIAPLDMAISLQCCLDSHRSLCCPNTTKFRTINLMWQNLCRRSREVHMMHPMQPYPDNQNRRGRRQSLFCID